MPDPDLEIRKRGRSSRPLDKGGGGGRGRSPKKSFSTLQALVWSKNKGGGAPRAPPLDPPLNKTQGWTMHPSSTRADHSLA